MTRLFFIRHGKTEWNLEGRYQGAHGDSPLLSESYREIQQLCLFLREYQFSRIYCSPILRAKTTAEKIAEGLQQKIDVKCVASLREFNLGKMEGMKFTEVAKLYPQELEAFRYHAEKYDPSKIDGESFDELFKRMTPTIKKIVELHGNKNENVLIVSHGAALCAEIRHLLGYPLEELRAEGGLANTSTTILETNSIGDYKCLAWNKTDYLKRKLDSSDIV
ncbi:phosphoglycerate mutase [Liquorilactobacillus aquaticus DSM 21051]|uniref:Phosphoglycerate mutase n=1 Tax=Liquorilactobacillus aquaticus DSM 21051 TaxID=1423725 RepID=A0A0R2CXF5_9LACO|nr:histidine phosphatase family protein [Liquorilactobacillus aquaticus]KRM96520.1 phosphoglycerate mutase [Liquorilactobacillus aquaticus DSM 21051]